MAFYNKKGRIYFFHSLSVKIYIFWCAVDASNDVVDVPDRHVIKHFSANVFQCPNHSNESQENQTNTTWERFEKNEYQDL